MREIRLSGSEGGGPNPIASPYPYRYFAPLGLNSDFQLLVSRLGLWPKADHRECDVIGLGVIPDKIVHRTDHSMANFVWREAGTTLERILHSGFSEQFLICGVSFGNAIRADQ